MCFENIGSSSLITIYRENNIHYPVTLKAQHKTQLQAAELDKDSAISRLLNELDVSKARVQVGYPTFLKLNNVSRTKSVQMSVLCLINTASKYFLIYPW